MTAVRPYALGLAASVGAVLGGALLAGGGSDIGPLFWIGGGALLIGAVGLAVAFAGFAPVPVLTREGIAFLGLLAALAAWSALSIHWSIEPDRSWDYANRGLVYLAFAVCGAVVAAVVPRAPTVAAAGLAGLLGALTVWALAGKVFPGVEPDYARVARLRTPVGYWNALALLLAIALPLALWAASSRELPSWARALGAVLAFSALSALPLTYSRGGLALAAALAAAWLWLSDERLEGLATLAIAGVPAALVAAVLFSLPGVTHDGQTLESRRHDGAVLGMAVLLGSLIVWVAAWYAMRYESRLREERRRQWTRWGLYAFAGLLAACVVGYAAATGPSAWVHQFRNTVSHQNTQGASHLTSTSSGNRWFWWQEAWNAFVDHPVNGTGAGSFEITHRIRRTNALVATEPHQLPLQFMTETGIVGFLLAAGATIAALLGLWRILGRRDRDRSARVALALAPPAYLAYALVDFDWDFVAVTGPVLFVTGLLLVSGARERPKRRPIAALGALVIGAMCAYSLALPWLAARRIDQAYTALGESKPARAVDLARSAHGLNPLSLAALTAWADAAESAGNLGRAWGVLQQAADSQPDNWAPRYDLGVFELDVLNKPCPAYYDLNRSYTLDRWGLPAEKDGPLDKARDAVNSGACAQ